VINSVGLCNFYVWIYFQAFLFSFAVFLSVYHARYCESVDCRQYYNKYKNIASHIKMAKQNKRWYHKTFLAKENKRTKQINEQIKWGNKLRL